MSEKNNLLNQVLLTVQDNRTLFIRLTVGLILLSEGIQKFLSPALRKIVSQNEFYALSKEFEKKKRELVG